MRALLISLVIGTLPALALSQSAAPAAKPAAKSATAKNKKLAPSAQKAVEEVTPIDDDPNLQLSDADLAVAKKVYTGEIRCELGATVRVVPMKREGLFLVSTKNFRFRMHPVESRTGAIRLEDPVAGAMWLQLANKSMLMSQKFGTRLADECHSPEQAKVAEDMKNKPAINILEPSPATAPASAASGRQ